MITQETCIRIFDGLRVGKNEEETTPDEYKLKAIILCRVIVNIDLVIPTTLY